MSEFVEIGDYVLRRSDIKHATKVSSGVVVLFVNGETASLDEPYESVRDKLLGKNRGPDPRAVFARQLADWFRKDGFGATANMVEQFYNSTMLSETEGAG